MKAIPVILSGAVLVLGLVLSSTVSFGKPEYTKKEKKGCVTCHVSAKSKDLNDTGKCYGEKKDLAACTK
jgi:hypothetical protein